MMGPRLQWTVLFLILAAVVLYFIKVGGNGPCGNPGDFQRYACQHSSGSRFYP